MTDSGKGLARSLEATYWRVMRKKVRAENIMSGARETFVDRFKRNYFGLNGTNGAPHLRGANGAPVTVGSNGALKAARTAVALAVPPKPTGKERARAAAAAAAVVEVKPRLPIPFYGLHSQAYRSREVVFTCIVGDRHFLQERIDAPPYEHVLYVDRDLSFSGWDQRPLLFWDAAPKLITLFHKFSLSNLVAHGTKMLWVDSRVDVTAEIAKNMFASLDDHDLCLFRHYERDCVYDEILAVLEARRSTVAQCEEYARYLRDRGFPRNAGLYETGAMAFRVCPEVTALFRAVFGLCYRYAPRDQLALPLALSNSPVRVHVFNGGETNLRNTPGVLVKSWKDLPR